MAAKERLAEVVARHAPVLYMHPRDHFMPSTVEWFSASAQPIPLPLPASSQTQTCNSCSIC